DPQTDNSNVVEINKNNGDLVSPFFKEYDLGAADGLAEIVYHDGFIYGTGRYTDGGGPPDMRHTLVKLNANDGSQVWVRLGHVAANQTARLYGADLIVLQNTIYSAYFGDPDGTSTTDNIMYVQQTSLDGELLWLRAYNIPGALGDAAVELIASNGGIVVYAKERFSTPMLVLFKIDLDGELLWSHSYEFPGNILSFLEIENARSSQLIGVNDKIVFTAFGVNESNGTNSVVVITNLNGEINEGCVESNFIQMTSDEVANPVFYEVNPSMTTRQPEISNLTVSVRNSIPQLQCSITDTLVGEVTATICQGETFEGYSVSGTFTDPFITEAGCDSIRILHLTVIAPVTFSFNQEICSGEIFEGYSTTGIFIDTFEAESGCDSIRTLSLTVNPPVTFTLNKNICHNEVFEGYTISGTYADTFALSNGCDSVRILNLSVFACAPIIYYDLNACRSYMEDGSVMDYSEFTPAYPEGSCAEVSAEILQRIPASENKHSCTPGVNNTIAMCVSSYSSCTYSAGNSAAIVIDFHINPIEDSIFRLQGLQFYEKAPTTYSWVNGDSGPNNYPRRYGIRILKNGVEIFRNENVPTNFTWTLQSFNFIDNDLFRVENASDFRIELLPYCPIGNGAVVSAWDIDEVRIVGACLPIDNNSTILGSVSTKDDHPIRNVQLILADNNLFNQERTTVTDAQGAYGFEEVEPGACYLKGYKNDDVTNGVSTLDLVHIQRHLLGKTKFTSLHQYVAADVNHNNSVNAIDLIDIQKLLLGKTAEFPRNTSWRFGSLPQDMTGEDISQFREIHQMEITDPGTYEADLVGIKIGDINGDVQLITTPGIIEARSAKSFSLVVEEQNSVLNIKAGDDVTIAGMQFALQVENFEAFERGLLQVETNNYSISKDGLLRFVWVAGDALKITKGDLLFSVVLKSNQPAVVAIDELLSPALYTDDLQTLKLELVFENNPATAEIVDRFSIEPNPFQSELTIRLNLIKEGDVQIRFYDLSGRMLHQTNNRYLHGEHTERIAGNLLGTEGVLYCQIVSNGQTSVQKVVRLQ
ncbi:MAG TPA: T9SS type A sorting domain-containing protein, partial [Saprospiraceae bacterium]|nr:T9SS type A sorting domain-containing protein [Saprospiraceae bacterium]